MEEIEIIQIRPVKFEEIVDLRYSVLRAGLPRSAAEFDGDDAPTTLHLAAKRLDKVIGCATIMLNEWESVRAYQLRGMAVDPADQSRGVGRRILIEIERMAREGNVSIIWANARVPASNFYKQNGWQIASEQFEIPTAGPHYKMLKRLRA